MEESVAPNRHIALKLLFKISKGDKDIDFYNTIDVIDVDNYLNEREQDYLARITDDNFFDRIVNYEKEFLENNPRSKFGRFLDFYDVPYGNFSSFIKKINTDNKLSLDYLY